MYDANVGFWFSGKVTNIPTTMVNNQFGMVGLLTFIRAAESDPNLVTLALGTDLTGLGLNLNSQDSLHPSFAGPFSDFPCRYLRITNNNEKFLFFILSFKKCFLFSMIVISNKLEIIIIVGCKILYLCYVCRAIFVNGEERKMWNTMCHRSIWSTLPSEINCPRRSSRSCKRICCSSCSIRISAMSCNWWLRWNCKFDPSSTKWEILSMNVCIWYKFVDIVGNGDIISRRRSG